MGIIYYRLVALWVLCEAMLGGIIHGLKIPVSGLVVGSCAVICICLIAWYAPVRGAILKATLIVAIFKMMLSPQASFPAYIAVFFQGFLGEILFTNRKAYTLSCFLLAILALLESGTQRILVYTIIYGNDFWTLVNDFFNGLSGQKHRTNYGLLIGGGYVLLHLITGIFVGWWASQLPKRIERWSGDPQYKITPPQTGKGFPEKLRRKKKIRTGLVIIWILVLALYVQSYFKVGEPILPSNMAIKILVRSIIIVCAWVFVIGPLLRKGLHVWLQKKQSQTKNEIQAVLELLPATQNLVAASWKNSQTKKGWGRVKLFNRFVLTNALTISSDRIYILTAPVQSGKTTAVLNWTKERNDVSGIATPLINGRRTFQDLLSKEAFSMEAASGEVTIDVGRYKFSKRNFEKAIQVIQLAIQNKGWLVIDEIGPLELKNEGFATVLKQIILNRTGQTLLVVREGLADKVKTHFNIPGAIIISEMSGLNI